ncbi:TylF/MycF family methyltransferase [Stieleria sp. TO1_6]|uniref:TylF/MycF family methyltransferase n=1 Tax=Stieleria tagensis TaxID=2956795 RepID=UPI00209B7EF1|nr:TylF/MycF family methyltransferase [Stieleria tagensis]MCO8123441.1 TylF/MycF family methyltransferase [Stieleria tagensis]
MKKTIRNFLRRAIGSRSLPFPNDRLRVVAEAIEYVSTMSRFDSPDAQDSLRGDYLEFGVWRGDTFAFACGQGEKWMPSMRFFAFDSFEGLPEPKGSDANSEFQQGQFCCSLEKFMENLKRKNISREKFETIEGWFDKSLTPETVALHKIHIASVSYIDCDLYESCVPVLEFLSPLIRQGSILMFDDWFCFRSSPKLGVQRATSEWLSRNTKFELIPWKTFGPYGKAFFVNFDI